MNVATMTMPVDEAKEAYRRYRQAVRDNPTNKADQAIMLGYRALAKGRAIIDLIDVLRKGGVDEVGRPKLAVGRASWTWVRWSRLTDGFIDDSPRQTWTRRRGIVGVPRGTFPTVEDRTWKAWRAMVPLISPQLRPAGDLYGYHILWEADWQVAPKDPALLKHLYGDLYAVLAVWDLSPLERAVLGAVRQEQR